MSSGSRALKREATGLQFDNKWIRLFKLSHGLAFGQSKEPLSAARGPFTWSLCRAAPFTGSKTILTKMSQKLEAVLAVEKPKLAFAFRHTPLNKAVSNDHTTWHS